MARFPRSGDCQRQTLLNFMSDELRRKRWPCPWITSSATPRSSVAPTTISNAKTQLFFSYSFDRSNNPNQTFDVPTYGTTANGIEGASHIQSFNVNGTSTINNNVLNEAHFTYSRETRPRAAIDPTSVPDTALGFSPNFRFGQPFFLEPTVDELIDRHDIRDNISVVHGKHTFKFGGEWLHTYNTQVFRGFFTGRYIFDSATGFLHYASPIRRLAQASVRPLRNARTAPSPTFPWSPALLWLPTEPARAARPLPAARSCFISSTVRPPPANRSTLPASPPSRTRIFRCSRRTPGSFGATSR